MSQAFLTNWSFGDQGPDTRNRFHEIALREARIASEYRDAERSTPIRESFLTRFRLVFAGRPATDACNCPA
jgi:hypothetical protein